MSKPQQPNQWRPIPYPSGPLSSRLLFGSVGFFRLICRLIYAVNALAQMRVGSGLKLTKCESGWLLEADPGELNDGLQVRWLKICKRVDGTSTEFWIKARCSQLYTVNEDGSVGAIVPGEPYGV